MKRSLTKELFTPFKDLEQEFHSSRKLFKTLKTMEEYISKTQADYGSGIVRPKIDDKDHFDLKSQFLKELHDNTFSAIQAQLNNLGREIKKVNEKVYAAQLGCELCKGPHYTKGYPLKEEDFIILDMPEDVKGPLILERPFFSTTHAKIDMFKRKITLRVSDEKIIFKSVKPASSLIKRVYMLSLKERIELNLEARLIGETLVLNRSLDPLYGDYIELNDLNVPLELRRDQVDDLMPTIEECEVIDKPMIIIIMTRNDESFNGYLSFCDFDRKIHIDCAYNLRFLCMIVVENMATEIKTWEMQFLENQFVDARRLDGFITICDGNDNMTYQMA
uniref:Reverse transcriptase domain-containing protein n=1 Tax=Tanacetum cinerariifolium TaxID=118510 RepID=A0A6L2JLL8_TANCI|nr:hypothetical protein [Tanacetum cinerariifolium]